MKVNLLNISGITDALVSVGLPMQNTNSDILLEDYNYYKTSGIRDEVSKKIDLMSRLVKAGPDHSKAVRGIWATIAITAPRYWWSEMDTYKVGVQPLSSTSTMHKITSRDLIPSDFEDEQIIDSSLNLLNHIRNRDDLTKVDKLRMMKKHLPESYLQTRVLQINYQALRNIYFQRRNHRLEEWKYFCEEIEKFEYSKKLIIIK